MKQNFTKKELEIMKILWNSDKPMIASDIIKQSASLNINTVQACLRTLLKANVIKIADIVYSGTVLTRNYSPVLTKEEYFDNIYSDIIGSKQTFPLIKCLIDSETELAKLEQLEKIIAQKKKEIQQGEQK